MGIGRQLVALRFQIGIFWILEQREKALVREKILLFTGTGEEENCPPQDLIYSFVL